MDNEYKQYVPKKEPEMTAAALKANLRHYLNLHDYHVGEADDAMSRARDCIDKLSKIYEGQ